MPFVYLPHTCYDCNMVVKPCPHWRLVADFGDNLSPKTATGVAENGDCRQNRPVAEFGDYRQCGQDITVPNCHLRVRCSFKVMT